MKRILFIFFLFCSAKIFSQVPQLSIYKFVNGLIIPFDTTNNKVEGSIAYKNGTFYGKDSYKYKELGGTSVYIQSISSNKTLAIDTTTTVKVDASSTPVIVTLVNPNKYDVTVKKIDSSSNPVTIIVTGHTIDDNSNAVIFKYNKSYNIRYDGTQFIIVAASKEFDAGSGTNITNDNITNTGDLLNTNELQLLSNDNSHAATKKLLTLSQANTLDLGNSFIINQDSVVQDSAKFYVRKGQADTLSTRMFILSRATDGANDGLYIDRVNGGTGYIHFGNGNSKLELNENGSANFDSAAFRTAKISKVSGATTVDISKGNIITCNDASATVIDSITSIGDKQRVLMYFNNANTSITNTKNIGFTYTSTANSILEIYYNSSSAKWYKANSSNAFEGSAITGVVLNTPNVIFSTPVNYVVSGGTATGTLTLNNQTANTILAGPASGSATAPTMRALVEADLPNSAVLTTFTNSATTTVANTTTETTLIPAGVGSLAVPANYFTVGKTYKITLYGLLSTDATPGNVTVRLKCGTTLANVTVTNITASLSNRQITLEFLITCFTIGASGTLMGNGFFMHNTSASVTNRREITSTSATTVNTTSSLNMSVTWEWASALATNTITIYNALITENN